MNKVRACVNNFYRSIRWKGLDRFNMSYFNKFIIATGLALSRTIHGSSCVKTYATWPAVSFFLIANLYHLTFLALGSLRSRGEAKVEIAIFTETVLRRI